MDDQYFLDLPPDLAAEIATISKRDGIHPLELSRRLLELGVAAERAYQDALIEQIEGCMAKSCPVERKFDELPGWTFRTSAVSIVSYGAIGRSARGDVVAEKGVDPEAVLELCKSKAAEIHRGG